MSNKERVRAARAGTPVARPPVTSLYRRYRVRLLWCVIAILLPAIVWPVAAAESVRVAAIQCPSVMGQTASNVRTLVKLVRQAAAQGAKIVVTPECAVPGYVDPLTWTSWVNDPDDEYAVQTVAEPVPGAATRTFAALADELNIYLAVGLIEVADQAFYNTLVLLAPDGTLVGHHRKRSLWTPGDAAWCTAGDRPAQVVATEYGNLGLMICYDVHHLPPLLAQRKADIVLYAVGWYGPNEKHWFTTALSRKTVLPYGFSLVAANWCGATADDDWPGRGHSCIISPAGKVLAMSQKVLGTDIVLADIPSKPPRPQP